MPNVEFSVQALRLGEEGGAGLQHRLPVDPQCEVADGGIQPPAVSVVRCGHAAEGRAWPATVGAFAETRVREAGTRSSGRTLGGIAS